MHQSGSYEDRQEGFHSLIPAHLLASGFCGTYSITKWYSLLSGFHFSCFSFQWRWSSLCESGGRVDTALLPAPHSTL